MSKKYMNCKNINIRWVAFLLLSLLNISNNLQAQTLGDVRACFDVDLQDTIVWFESYRGEKTDEKFPGGRFEKVAYLIFERDNVISFEKWYTIVRVGPLLMKMGNINNSAWQYPDAKFSVIPPGSQEKISVSMIKGFNNFRDSMYLLSERIPMSNDWKRFIRKSVVTTAATMFYLDNEHGAAHLDTDYYGRQFLNVMILLRYMDCLNKKDYLHCEFRSFLGVSKFRYIEPTLGPVIIEGNSVYVRPDYLSDFYDFIRMNLPRYIKQYPDYREFTSNMFFRLYSGLSHFTFDAQEPVIQSFERH